MTQANNPLHGITLEAALTRLVEHYGWAELGGLISIACFNNNPSLKSSLKFLRKTPWARTRVEELYLHVVERGVSIPAPTASPDA
ncbi:MAG TPA: VF530 family protein [Patescibacteria group bacterium]|nr:VF530 family protein [Patescibacteria group bacterium]